MSARLIADQIEYYRRRASEYDRTSTLPGDPFAADAERIRAHIRALRPSGRVLELACGTGQWTGLLAESADELTAVDASPEMLRLNAEKVADPRIRYITADLFEFAPDRRYDTVFFAAWLSHVPPERFVAFWELVAACLAPDGRVLFFDETDHGLWAEEWVDRDGAVARRQLLDGSVHRIVKVLWAPSELEARLRQLGWEITVEQSGPFLWGTASQREL
ncbi:MAG: class I SAM-dependent methyltransferase [Chloroflexota bacterium]